LVEGNSEAEDEAMVPAKEIKTPAKVQQLQRTLYCKAKEDGRWRAWSLYGDLCRREVLEAALRAVVRNAGVAGVDGLTTEQVKAAPSAFLDELQTQLRTRSYRPGRVLRVWIPKGDGKQRPLGIPTVKDRIVQMALLLLLQPIFEADFHEDSYGYRPGRHAHQALDTIRAAIWHGRYEVIDADLSGYFDTINHAALLRLVARRVSDGSILGLVKGFLKAPIVEEKSGRRTIHPNKRGTPQGGVISPMLANLYLNSLDHGVNDHPELDAKLVRYADDFVLLCRPGHGMALYERLKVYLQHKGLTLNETKTRVLDVRRESFRFLGFEVSWRPSRYTGKHYPQVEPSRKARQELRDAVRRELNHWTTGRSCVATVRTVNQTVRGWSQYFHYGHCTRTYVRMQDWLRQRYRKWLWKKYGRTLGYYTFFTNDRLQGQYQLFTLPSHAPRASRAKR
jgi:group II intron reverse transcriptase/maturase